MSLKKYHEKRNFRRTKEPLGKKVQSGKKLLFVIQKHAASRLHYDFRLEFRGVLKSWAVPKGPSLDPKVKHLAVEVEDHPLEYAKFEGIIPKGEYGGGTVMVWDVGTWESLDDNIAHAFKKGDLNFNLRGEKLKGRWKLIRIKNKSPSEKNNWLLFKVEDEFSCPEKILDIQKKEPYSVASHRSMDQIKNEKNRVWTRKGEVISKVKRLRLNLGLSKIKGAKKDAISLPIFPELSTLTSTPPEGNHWLHEIKWDGYRLVTIIENGRIKLMTRRNNDWTYYFPTLVNALKSCRFKNIILDGELVALNKDRQSDFQLLQNSIEEENLEIKITYYVFDLLFYNGYSLLNVDLLTRKEILKKILDNQRLPEEIQYNDHIIGQGKMIFDKACQLNLEGIISKKINSHYIQGRTKEWFKVKCISRQEFIIGGYTDPKSSRKFFGALLIGYYDKNKHLIYGGKVGTGFTQSSLKELSKIFSRYIQKTSPFYQFPRGARKSIHWLEPKLVAEFEYGEITQAGVLRHASFKGLRWDKNPESISLEKEKSISANSDSKVIDNQKFTHLNRVLYKEQGFTKEDLVHYYELVKDWILPHIKNRPLTLLRCPSGYDQCFYQKHLTASMPSTLKKIDILEKSKKEPYIYIDDFSGLLGLVQMGVLEIHPWGSSIKDVEKPDRLVFDLDPDSEVEWEDVIKAAKLLHDFLDYLHLKSFVKTTGGKGLHIVVPIKPDRDWEVVRDFTQKVAEALVQANPKQFVATMSKAKRKGKIFIDYFRNMRGATSIATFSTRARSNAPVAVPLDWDELTYKIHSNSFNIMNINQRLNHLKSDPWEDFFKTRQKITDKMLTLFRLKQK